MSLTTTQKINQVINPKYLGFSISDNNETKFDDDVVQDVDRLYELTQKLKEKLNKAVPQQFQAKEESKEYTLYFIQVKKNELLFHQKMIDKQLEDDVLIENLNQIGKKFSFQSVDNLKKNIHLFDPKLERVKHELQTQAQQQKLALLMNSLQSFGASGGEVSQFGDSKNSNNRSMSTVSQCLQILESRKYFCFIYKIDSNTIQHQIEYYLDDIINRYQNTYLIQQQQVGKMKQNKIKNNDNNDLNKPVGQYQINNKILNQKYNSMNLLLFNRYFFKPQCYYKYQNQNATYLSEQYQLLIRANNKQQQTIQTKFNAYKQQQLK